MFAMFYPYPTKSTVSPFKPELLSRIVFLITLGKLIFVFFAAARKGLAARFFIKPLKDCAIQTSRSFFVDS
jgi:hypothetical protein